VCVGGAGILLVGTALICHLARKKNKKKYNFGIKKSWNQVFSKTYHIQP
jgi:hypothetical protein